MGPISLVVESGECVAVTGASGSGKSLLLRAIVDLDPSDGTVWLDGTERGSLPADVWRRMVAMVPTESGWWADRVEDHLPPEAATGPLLDAAGLPDAASWEIARLSSGERQRLALVRALCNRPRVLLLDEPTAALDPTATARVEDLLRAERAAGVAVLLVTHDAAQAARLASRRFAMHGQQLQPLTESRR